MADSTELDTSRTEDNLASFNSDDEKRSDYDVTKDDSVSGSSSSSSSSRSSVSSQSSIETNPPEDSKDISTAKVAQSYDNVVESDVTNETAPSDDQALSSDVTVEKDSTESGKDTDKVSSQASIEVSPAEENKETSAAEVTRSDDKLVDSDVTEENDLLERDQIAASVKSTRTSSSSDSSSDSDDEERADSPPPIQIAETKTIPPVKAESSPPTQAETVEEAGKSYQAESASESDQAPSPVPLNEMPPVGSEEAEKNSSSKEEAKLMKKVQITDEAHSRPTAAHPKSARFSEVRKSQNLEPVSSELHVVRYRKTRSAPPRPRGFHAQSSNLVFLHKECERIERKLAQSAKANLVKRPKITPYKPFTWNSLAPYYNTDTLRYVIHMPVNVRRGYNTRPTACGLVDPETSWKMDHCVTPMTPSRPELFRRHYVKRRTRSAMPRLTSDNSLMMPKFPRVTSASYGSPATQDASGKPRTGSPPMK
ncbi:unnamed protein product [Clavelina lepadiformis]|uniref:Uncharacterized protein n=1 Tax=Clavelina lepadiformis TaxID=159417 RepID=A0ABP0FV65_CLALP